MRMALPVALWALHFTAIYGFTALACARGFAGAVPWTVGAMSALAALLAVFLLISNLSARFERWMTAALAAFALVAIVFETLTVVLVPACALR